MATINSWLSFEFSQWLSSWEWGWHPGHIQAENIGGASPLIVGVIMAVISKHGHRRVPDIASYILCFVTGTHRQAGWAAFRSGSAVKIHVFSFGFGRFGVFLADLQVKTRSCHSTHGIFKKVCCRAVSKGESPTWLLFWASEDSRSVNNLICETLFWKSLSLSLLTYYRWSCPQ